MALEAGHPALTGRHRAVSVFLQRLRSRGRVAAVRALPARRRRRRVHAYCIVRSNDGVDVLVTRQRALRPSRSEARRGSDRCRRHPRRRARRPRGLARLFARTASHGAALSRGGEPRGDGRSPRATRQRASSQSWGSAPRQPGERVVVAPRPAPCAVLAQPRHPRVDRRDVFDSARLHLQRASLGGLRRACAALVLFDVLARGGSRLAAAAAHARTRRARKARARGEHCHPARDHHPRRRVRIGDAGLAERFAAAGRRSRPAQHPLPVGVRGALHAPARGAEARHQSAHRRRVRSLRHGDRQQHLGRGAAPRFPPPGARTLGRRRGARVRHAAGGSAAARRLRCRAPGRACVTARRS